MSTLPYAMVGKRRSNESSSVVLAEFAFDSNGPFPSLARELLEKEEGQTMKGHVDGYTLLNLEREGLVFVVAAKKEADRSGREALQLIAGSFAARIGMARARGATRRYAFNAEFGSSMQRHLEKFSRQGELDEDLHALQSDLENVKGKAQNTITKMVERGSMIDSLSNTASNLSGTSQRFRDVSTQLKRMEIWQTWKGKIIAFLSALAFCLFIWLIVKS